MNMDFKAIFGHALLYFDWGVLVYFIVVNSFYTLLLFMAIPELFKHLLLYTDDYIKKLFSSETAPSITIIAPAFNEEANIIDSLESMLTLEYPKFEIIAVNDGSKDETLSKMMEHFDLYEIFPIYRKLIDTKNVRAIYRSRTRRCLVVVDKDNGGKADALNVGLNLARGKLICAIDADTILESDSLIRMVRPFLLNPVTVAVGGTIRIVNDCTVENSKVVEVRPPRHFIPAVQVVEYLRAYLFGRLGLNKLGGNFVVSGAFGLFQRETIIEIGGYFHDTVGEDMELVVRIHRTMHEKKKPYAVEFIPDPVAWTEAPETLEVLARQRDRWHRGLADTMFRHIKMLFNPRYGAAGMIIYPYYFFIELLSPVIEFVGYFGLLFGLIYEVIDLRFALMFFFAAYGLGFSFSLFSIVLEEASFHKYGKMRHIFFLIFIAMLENTNIRQLTVFWRLKGFIKYLRGEKGWGEMERRGFSGRPAPSSSTVNAEPDIQVD